MTIKDLARLSGYSVGTVSRALNGLPNVSEQARSAILALAQERGYQLNTNAKYLKQIHSSGIVAVVTGRAKYVRPLMWVAGLAFLLYFLLL